MFSQLEKIIITCILSICAIFLLGIIVPLHPDFIQFTPLYLCLLVIFLLFGQEFWTKKTIFLFAFAFLSSWFFSYLGTKESQLWGNSYTFSNILGWKILDTPLSIGLFWLINICGMAALGNLAYSEKATLRKSIFGALLLVSLDVLIEPAANLLNFWQWSNSYIPKQNYTSHFIIGFIQLFIFHYFEPKFQNKIAIVLLIIQFLFFGIFNILHP